MIPDSAIEEAARFLANNWTSEVSPYFLFPRAVRMLEKAANNAKHGEPIGASVPCKGGTASVKVWDNRVYGYLPGDERPSHVWPAGLAESMRNLGRMDSPSRPR